MHLTMVFLTFRADAFEDKIGTLHLIALRQLDFRNGKFFETNGLATMLAVKMNMHVVVNSVVMAVA